MQMRPHRRIPSLLTSQLEVLQIGARALVHQLQLRLVRIVRADFHHPRSYIPTSIIALCAAAAHRVTISLSPFRTSKCAQIATQVYGYSRPKTSTLSGARVANVFALFMYVLYPSRVLSQTCRCLKIYIYIYIMHRHRKSDHILVAVPILYCTNVRIFFKFYEDDLMKCSRLTFFLK